MKSKLPITLCKARLKTFTRHLITLYLCADIQSIIHKLFSLNSFRKLIKYLCEMDFMISPCKQRMKKKHSKSFYAIGSVVVSYLFRTALSSLFYSDLIRVTCLMIKRWMKKISTQSQQEKRPWFGKIKVVLTTFITWFAVGDIWAIIK